MNTTLADLVSLVGLLIAICLYGMLLWMVLQHGRHRCHRHAPGGGDDLALSTALLGLVWNVGAFWLLLPGSRGPVTVLARLMAATAYGALGFLPAVFVDTALRPWCNGRRAGSWIPQIGYGLSALAGAAHVYEVLATNSTPSVVGLRILAIGFCGLIPALLWVAPREARVSRGLVSSLALLAFGVCAFHLSGHAPGADTLSSAFFGHHASLPLILAILYEDYRFGFVDLFLKRALALVLLSGLVLGLYVAVLGPMLTRARGDASDARLVGTLFGLWVASAFLFPLLRRAVDRFVDVVVLRRPDYIRVRNEIQDLVARLESADEVLDEACARLRPALNAGQVRWFEMGSSPQPVTVLVPTTDAPHFGLIVADLPAGRRLLSDDVALIESIALLVARRVDSLRLIHERYHRDLREQEILRLATEAELRALQAQLNPHFLFNALNTLGYLMRAAPERALATLIDLTHLLRAVLKRATGNIVTLGQEMELVESYLAIERARFEERLRVSIEVPEKLRRCAVPPLIVQPLVENAIKHGITHRIEGGEVTITAWVESPGGGSLVIQVFDSGPGTEEHELAAGRRRGLGLANIERRLAAYYGERGSLALVCRPGSGTRATLRLPVRLPRSDERPSGTEPGTPP